MQTPSESLPSRECGLKFFGYDLSDLVDAVTPLAGVWIEMRMPTTSPRYSWVTPLAGVWIEIHRNSRRRYCRPVTPLAGVWIEMQEVGHLRPDHRLSLPSRECGLK